MLWKGHRWTGVIASYSQKTPGCPGNPEMYGTTEDNNDVLSARHFDIRCLMTVLGTQTSSQHPELGLHMLILLCSYTPVL